VGSDMKGQVLFDLIVLFYMDSLNKTRSLFYIKVHEAKKALTRDIGKQSPLFGSPGQRLYRAGSDMKGQVI